MSGQRFTWRGLGAAVVPLVFTASCASRDDAAPEPASAPPGIAAPVVADDDPARLIRFDTAAGADARRAKLIAYVWGSTSLPEALPAAKTGVSMPSGMDGVDAGDVASVDLLDATIGDTGVHSFAYVLHPVNALPAGERVVIVHQGHSHRFSDAGIGRATTRMLEDGFTVVAMDMPLFGWNAWNRVRWTTHNAMFEGVPFAGIGAVFRIFLEPVVEVLNYVTTRFDRVRDVSMFGVSGGGWTTAMIAAVDPRVRFSIQVAGSAPLYARDDPEDFGDREQFEPSLYGEDIAADGSGGGVATWLEIDVLGGYGEGRSAIQITSEHDPCCFDGTFAEGYAPIVADRVRALAGGEWSYFLDETTRQHEISEWALSTIIEPALGVPEDD